MINSSERKLALCGWLKHFNNRTYCSSLKLQKYLFLYESFSKVCGEQAEFSYLRGYERGPVFSTVYGDYTKDRAEFDAAVEEQFATNDIVDEKKAKKSAFIVESLSERDLSELTHKFNIWATKSNRIMSGESQVALDERDFSQHDYQLIQMLDHMYPESLVEGSEIISIGNTCFVFTKEDARKITEQHYDIMCSLAEQEELVNPVYVTFDQGGAMILD